MARTKSRSSKNKPAEDRGYPPPAPITLTDLAAKLADPDVPERELEPYLTIAPSSKGFSPILLPNEHVVSAHDDPLRTRADLGLGFLNGAMRVRRRRRFERRLRDNDPAPILLAEGDSWFQYPIFVEDIIDHLSNDYNICCLSAAGDEIDNMAIRKPEYLDWVARLTNDGRRLRALLISGGGNDLVGEQLSALIHRFDSTRSPADYINHPKFRERMQRIEKGYRTIFSSIAMRWPSLTIVVHGYDYGRPLPDQGFSIPPRDGWTGKPLRANGINDPDLQLAIVMAMIDRFNDLLEALSREFPRVVYVNVRLVVGDDWGDELHATDAGFGRVAGRFREALE